MNKLDAKMAAQFSKILSFDKFNRVSEVTVPGHEAKMYDVILRRDKSGHKVTGECRLSVGSAGHVPCKGNSHSVCYHTLAAVEVAVSHAGKDVSFCTTIAAAKRLARLYGVTPLIIGSYTNSTEVYAVVH